jgi:hypothetical protein
MKLILKIEEVFEIYGVGCALIPEIPENLD